MNLNRNGLIGTTIFHVLIALLLIFFGFSYPDPPPEEEGILVNFGTEQTGLGNVEPAGDQEQGGETETVPETTPVKKPVPDVTPQQTKPAPVETADKQVQDYEESPVKEKKPTAEEIRKQELERQKAQQERIRQEELRKQRLEEQRKKEQADKLQKMGKNAFGNKGVGTTEGSEGITSGKGNQGSPEGTPGVDNYGTGGGLGNGISYGLGNRRAVGSWPRPVVTNCEVTSRIIVKVQVDVDSKGNVVGEPQVPNATYQDKCIYEAVLNAARHAKFSVDPNSVKQRGWISYIIEPK
ncbi:MAG TPA: cell envelope integrity protein TolA [Bacteroidales bacterium]|nr:cell envelope integrity protein TolA [Bacteroidales bacterium]